MKVACVLGSPKPNGTSAGIAARFCRTAESLGAKVETFALNKLDYRGCQACMACKTGHQKCVLKDDLADVLAAVADADVLVMATPVYFGEIASQLKGFVDRTYAFLKPDFHTNPEPSRLKPGKRLVMILSQGNSDEDAFADIFPRYSQFFRWFGYEDAHLIHACGLGTEDTDEAREKLMAKTDAIARKVAG